MENINTTSKDVKDFDHTTLFFLIRFWGNFLQIHNSDKILNEELFRQSMDVLRSHIHIFNELSSDGSTETTKYFSERDFRNILDIIKFCNYHNNFPSAAHVKDLMNELLIDFDHNAYKYKQSSQELFIELARKIYAKDIRKLEKTAEIAIKYIKQDTTQLRFLCNGLETFEALDIVKHETRRLLLGKIKSILQKDEYKVHQLISMISLYPNKIRTKAFEQLIEIAYQKIFEKNLVPNMDQ